jgi:mono/diheme cytochrome c family protein
MSERATRIARDSVSLVDPEWKRTATLEEIADAVRRGTGRMEGFGGELSDEEIREVAGYVKWLPAPEASPR